MLLQKCSRTLRSLIKVKLKKSFTTTMDPLELVEMIEDYSLACTKVHYDMSLIMEALVSYLTCKQADYEDLCN